VIRRRILALGAVAGALLLDALDTAEEQEFSPSVELPCEGSSGLGQPMTMDVVLTAVAP
jgi:hypothetical protein